MEHRGIEPAAWAKSMDAGNRGVLFFCYWGIIWPTDGEVGT